MKRFIPDTRGWLLGGSYFLAALWGLTLLFSGQPIMLVCHGIALSFLVTLFLIFDAKSRRRPLPWTSYWLIGLTWPVTAPIYLVWTRGLKGLWRSGLIIITFFATILLSINFAYEMLITAADRHYEAGRYDKALDCLTRAIDEYPQSELYHNRGLIYTMMGQQKKAEADYRASQRLDAEDDTSTPVR